MVASDAAGGDAPALPILRLQPQDADGVWPLSIEAGWNQVATDWRLMLACGSAFGMKDAGGGWIASALALPLGPQVSWIGMVLVTRPDRRRGHGTRLLARCIAAIEASGRAMGLDATELGRPVYLPLGFRDLYTISRWSLPAASGIQVAVPAGIAVRQAHRHDLERIADCDRRCTGFERHAVLDHLFARAPHLAYLAERGDGNLAGYGLGRDGHRATHVGPVIADDPAIGLALASRALAGIRGPTIMDVPDRQEAIGQWLASQGASAPRSFMRMLRGAAPAVEDPVHIMAIAGPELA